jgi:hypothetical protein
LIHFGSHLSSFVTNTIFISALVCFFSVDASLIKLRVLIQLRMNF